MANRKRKREISPVDQGEYRVYKILKKSLIKGHVAYQLQWAGFENETSWELASQLTPEMIREYEENKDSNGVYRVTGAAFTRGQSQRSSKNLTSIPQFRGPYNDILRGVFDRYDRDGLYTVGVGFNRYTIMKRIKIFIIFIFVYIFSDHINNHPTAHVELKFFDEFVSKTVDMNEKLIFLPYLAGGNWSSPKLKNEAIKGNKLVSKFGFLGNALFKELLSKHLNPKKNTTFDTVIGFVGLYGLQ